MLSTVVIGLKLIRVATSYEYKSKAKYYSDKLGARANTPVINGMSATYVLGLAWVMAYYLQGCPSWTW